MEVSLGWSDKNIHSDHFDCSHAFGKYSSEFLHNNNAASANLVEQKPFSSKMKEL